MKLGDFTNVLLYGVPGSGKTTAVHKAFGRKAVWIATSANELDVAANRTLFPEYVQPRVVHCLSVHDPMKEMLQRLDQAKEQVLKGTATAIVIDQLSTWAQRLRTYMEFTLPGSEKAHGKLWDMLAARVNWIVDSASEVSDRAFFICICHERPSFDDKKGGPNFPGQMLQNIGGKFSLQLRCALARTTDGKYAPVFRCDFHNAAWLTKDRFGVVQDGETMDLKAVLQRALAVRRRSHGA